MPEIRIKRKYLPRPDRAQVKRGVLPDRRESEILARRRSSGIKFFDIAQVADGLGGFGRLNYNHVPTGHTYDTATAGAPSMEPSGGGFFTGLRDLVLGLAPVANFKTTFKQIASGSFESQAVSLQYTDDTLGPVTTDLLTSPKFANGQWKLSAAEAASVNFKMSTVTHEAFWDKITATPVMTDSDVSGSFVLSNKAEIYLMPQIIWQYSNVTYFDGTYVTGGGGGTIAVNEYGYPGFFALERSLISNYIAGIFMSGYARFWYEWNNLLKPNAAGHEKIMKYVDAGDPAPPHHLISTYSEPSTSAFPNPTYFNSSGPVVVDGSHEALFEGNAFLFYSGGKNGLKAVVKNDGAWYYFWYTSGTVV